jgi:cyclophilin family peptidyl-prolyl cis-trans isomerase
VDESLLDELDYESREPGFDKLLQDKRVLVEIKDKNPITVGDFTQAVKNEFYHGIELAIDAKRINKKKIAILENILQRKLLLQEALRQGIDKTDAYRQKVKEYENSVIFGMFIKKAVTPDIKLTLEELKTYYKEHAEQYTDPEMMRIKSLVFGKRSDAVEAVDKLKKGTDFNWLGSNAEGQVDPHTRGLLKLEGRPIMVKSLPDTVKKALSGSRAGDFRLYESPEGHFYALYIYEIIPARQQPFEAVRQEIARTVHKEKTKQMVGLWAAQLRDYYPVEIYRTDLRKQDLN